MRFLFKSLDIILVTPFPLFYFSPWTFTLFPDMASNNNISFFNVSFVLLLEEMRTGGGHKWGHSPISQVTIYPNPGTTPFSGLFPKSFALSHYLYNKPPWFILLLGDLNSDGMTLRKAFSLCFLSLFLFHPCYKVSLQVTVFHKENPSSCLLVLLLVPVEWRHWEGSWCHPGIPLSSHQLPAVGTELQQKGHGWTSDARCS